MLQLPGDILNHILYFTENKVIELCQVCKYFDKHCKEIRITDNENYPDIRVRNLVMCPNITRLNLEDNLLIINKGLKELKFLTTLILKKNVCITDISSLPQLRNLDLQWNTVITDIRISGLTNLKSLNLRGNRLITNKGVVNLVGLEILILSEDSPINDEGISNLTNLQILHIEGNNIKGKGLINLTNLTNLHLSVSSIEDDNVSHLVNLKHLKLLDSRITDNTVKNLTGLTSLDLYRDRIVTDEGISNLINLQTLHVNAKITDRGLVNLINLTKLDFYDAGYWTQAPSPITDDELKNLLKLKDLSLDYCCNGITDKGIINLTSLQSLLLKGNDVTGGVFKELPYLINLSVHGHSSVNDNDISGLTNLSSLALGWGNRISNNGIAELTNLKKLILRDNRIITDGGIDQLTNLEYLEIINDSGVNKITANGIKYLIKLKVKPKF